MATVLWVLAVLLAAILAMMIAAFALMVAVYWREGRREAEDLRRLQQYAEHVAAGNGRPYHRVQAVTQRPPRGHE